MGKVERNELYYRVYGILCSHGFEPSHALKLAEDFIREMGADAVDRARDCYACDYED